MVLEYKFEYVSNNNTLINFLDNISKKENLSYEIYRKDDFIYLYVEAEEEELLNNSNKLAQEIPMSIFLRNYTLEVVPEMPKKDYSLNQDYSNLSYCSNCLSNVENKESNNFYNPFFKCDICGTTSDVTSLRFYKEYDEIKYKNYKELFELLALKINEGLRVKIKTRSGEYVFYKTIKPISRKEKLICTNINFLSKLVVTAKAKAVALLCIEKPSLDFYINAIYKTNKKLDFDKINVRAAFNLTLYLLSKELEILGVDFLSYEKSDEFDYELTYNDDIPEIFLPYITINEGKTLVLENENYDKKLDDIYNKFEDRSKSQFMVLIEENKLYEKSILNLFISSLYDDNICLYSKKIDGVIDILNYNIPNSFETIFEEIEKEESGKRLLLNYKNKFPENFDRALSYKCIENQTNSIYSFWNLVSIILGFDKKNEDNNILLENAEKALLQKGPRIDYKLKKSDKIFNKEFDISKLIKSGMSFRLAGVDDKTLSLGYVESFADFIANTIDNVNEEFKLDGVSFCGDLIANEFFYKIMNKAITSKFEFYYNKDFPIQK